MRFHRRMRWNIFMLLIITESQQNKNLKSLKKVLTKRKGCDSMIKLSRGTLSESEQNLDK